MSLSPTPGIGGSSPQPIDYLGLLGGLSPLPFNPNTVISGLLAADQIPITNLQTQIQNLQTNESIYQSISGDVAALQAAAFNLTLSSTVQAQAVTSSNSAAVTGTAGPTVQPGAYTVAVTQLATATTATSTTSIGQAMTTTIAQTTPLNSLNLSGTPTSGTFSVVVDGVIQSITVDPTKPILAAGGALTNLQSAITSGLSDGAATVSITMAGNKVSIAITGASRPHTISLGGAGDTSNFLALTNLTTAQGTTSSGNLTLTSAANVGVAQVNASLSSASLATAPAASGTFSINGVSIAYNSATDSLSAIVGRINTSAAGVNALYNSVTDQLILTNQATGQAAMSLTDTTGNFLTAMNLAPGTTTAQKLGSNASVTVNGVSVASTSNTITNAVPGLTIVASATTLVGTPATLTVGVDVTGITTQVQSFVTSANKVINDINLTQQKNATTGQYSTLLGDTTLLGLRNTIMNTITGQVAPPGHGRYQNLANIGISTGPVGTAPALGTFLALSLSTSQLASALQASPQQVAALFNGTTAVNGFQGVAQALNTYLLQQTNPTLGPFAQYQSTAGSDIQNWRNEVSFLNNALVTKRQWLSTQFSAMTTALLNLASQSAIFASTLSTSATPTSTGH